MFLGLKINILVYGYPNAPIQTIGADPIFKHKKIDVLDQMVPADRCIQNFFYFVFIVYSL